MTCELIVVGDELVAGRVIDTNSALIARRLAQIGIGVKRITLVGDEVDSIRLALAESVIRSRLIIIAGGLGPTSDDRTREAVCELVNRKLVLDKKTKSRIQHLFRQRKIRMPKLAERQALIPAGAQIFPNPAGMVPGMVLKHQGSLIVLLPGVPEELEALLDHGIIGYLKAKFSASAVHNALIRTFGLIESRIAPKIEKILKKFADVRVGYYPSVAGLDLILSGPDAKRVNSCAGLVVKLLGGNVFAREEKNLAQIVGELLRRQKLTLATAESCTGGLVGNLITSVAGSSDYYLGGVVAYANETKTSLLGVREETLKRYGAVSAQTVKEMAVGVCRVIGTDCGIAVSGIAGPGGGTKEKPVGLVFIGVAFKGKVKVEKHLFNGTRMVIKERSAYSALDLLRMVLLKGL